MNAMRRAASLLLRVRPAVRSSTPSAATPAPSGSPREVRADLEGLRGVAVIAVLLFHLGFPWAAGGFVGVDAFFVLSGFLITGLIIREHERTGRISLPAFYARRVRRILPAALVTIVVTVGVAAFVLAPLDLPEITLDGAAAALSVGNIRFAIGATDYFGPTTPSPFRHFWSLGVEEQFYLLWPALMILALARGGSRRRVALVIGGVVAASFATSTWLTGVDQAWAFYSFPTRAWQLGLGGLLAATAGWFAARSGLLLGSIALAGVVGLVGAVVLIDGAMPYPGMLALLPAVATAAVVVGGDRRGPARWLLSLAPLRWFGRISYSLYLWHWPFLVLPVLALGRELALDERLALAGISIAVATASWRWIEEPFRRGWSPSISRPRTVLAGVGAMALTAAVAIGVGDGVVARLDAMASETAFVSEDAAYAIAPDEAVETEDASGGLDQAIASPTPSARASRSPAATLPTAQTAASAAAPPASAPASAPTAPPAATPVAPTAAATATPTATPGIRRLPADVAPPLTKARKDSESIVRDKCSLAISGSKPPICFYGPKDATLTVALVGDSHAAHWFPALEGLANERGWRLVPFTKYSCTFVDLRIYSAWLKREYTECEAWRTNVVKALRELKPDLVVVTSHRWFPTIVAGDDDATRQGEAMARLIRQLPGRIVLLADTPISRYDVPACLSRNLKDIRRCASDRAYALGAKPHARERVAARLTGAALVDLSDVICPGKGKCPAVVDGMIVYRDDHHLTATFAASLAPILGERLPAFGPGAP
jgi:peptidoglycan/LPS O-acetylase OafA/YrhL